MKTQKTINYLQTLTEGTVTIENEAIGRIVFLNGQTAFNLDDSAMFSEENKINAFNRIAKA